MSFTDEAKTGYNTYIHNPYKRIYYNMRDLKFSVTTMPSSRPADYYLCFNDGCVFIDYNNCGFNKIRLIRISFDGYGCCELNNLTEPMTEEESTLFKHIIQNNIPDQAELRTLVKSDLHRNIELHWQDALEEHRLL